MMGNRQDKICGFKDGSRVGASTTVVSNYEAAVG